MPDEKFFLGRQPILDRDQKIVAYELLFRSSDSLHANVVDYLHASASVIFDALSSFGFQEVVGKHKGFINVNHDVLMSDAVELLPKEQVVIELLENIEVTDEVVQRCRDLKAKGFTLAIDDNVYEAKYEPLYAIVDIVKIDLFLTTKDELPGMVANYKPWKVRLLAEKVETQAEFQLCYDLGMEFFQGYYFAKPVVLTRARVDVGRITLVNLLNQLLADSEVEDVERTFRQNPDLTIKLLSLVNSVAIGVRQKIQSLRHAIMILGLQQLKRWATMALFACKDSRGDKNPLLEMATIRGRLMELLVKKRHQGKGDPDFPDRAFMTGILSLVDVLLDVKMEDIAEQLNLSGDVKQALVGRDGELGILLTLTEKLELADFPAVQKILQERSLSADDLFSSQLETIQWMEKMHEIT